MMKTELKAIEPSNCLKLFPVMLVTKKSTRFSIDYRRLNEVTTKLSYSLPRIDLTSESLAKSTIDWTKIYELVKVHPEDMSNTAFSANTRL